MARGHRPADSERGSVTTVNQPLRGGRNELSRPELARCVWLRGWGPALVSLALAVAYGLYIALRTYEVDLGVYLRLGGRYVFTSHLYSLRPARTRASPSPIPRSPRSSSHRGSGRSPASARCRRSGRCATWPRSLACSSSPCDWSSRRSTKSATWRLALALSAPRRAAQPRADHHRLRPGEPVRHLPRHVGPPQRTPYRASARLPLGVATGLAAAVKLTPLLFVPYLV